MKQFESDGYLIVKGLLPNGFVKEVGSQAREYAKEYKGIQAWFRKYSGRHAVHCPSHHAGWARNLTTNIESVGEIASQLLKTDVNDPIKLVLDTLDYIPKGQVSAATAPFRKVEALRMWIPFEPTTNETAPLIIVRGSVLMRKSLHT